MPEHCPGCRGFTLDFQGECPGVAPRGALTVTRGPALLRQYVPRLHWRDRLGVLLGRQVQLTVSAGSGSSRGRDLDDQLSW